MSEFDKNLSQEIECPAIRKGFKGFWWNIINCGKLSKNDQKSVMRNTFVGGIIFIVAVAALITGGIIAVWGISEAVENGKPYSQVEIEEFRKNWNISASSDPSGITNGTEIKKSELNRYVSNVSIGDGSIRIFRSGKDIEKLNMTYTDHLTIEKRREIINEILTLCVPDMNHENTVNEYMTYETKYVEDGIKGFNITFTEASSKDEIEYKITTEYDYTYNIVAANTPSGCAFGYTIDDFIKNYNNYLSDAVKIIAKDLENVEQSDLEYLNEFMSWKISSVDSVKFDRTEEHGESIIDVYYYPLNYMGTAVGSIGFYIERETGYIAMLNQSLSCDFYNILDANEQYFAVCFTGFVYASIGFERNAVWDDYFTPAQNSKDYTTIKQGACAQTYIMTDNIDQYFYKMYALGNEKH